MRHTSSGARLRAALAALAGALTGAAAGAPALHAQQPADQKDNTVEEIVVTARKRAENLQDTPLAISAETGTRLEAAGVRDLSEASRFAPNVSFAKGGGIAGTSAAATVFIRGAGQSDFIMTSDPGVGVYVDGVYNARLIGASLELADIDRVEVLRGPQGTLFGRNTIGGAISVITKQPDADKSSYVSLTAGEKHHYGFKGGFNLPINENLFWRFNLMRRQRDGYVDLLQYSGRDLGNDDNFGFRNALRFQGDKFNTTLTYDYSDIQENGAPWVADKLLAFGNDPNFLFAHFANALGPNPGSCTTTGGQQTNKECWGPVWNGSKFETNNAFHTVVAGGTARKIRPFSGVKNYGINSTTELELGDKTLKFISGYRKLESGFTRSLSYTPVMSFENKTRIYDSEQFSQELQLTGSSFAGKLDWVTGAYYFTEKAIEVDDLFTSLFLRTDDTFKVKNTAMAALANATYHISDQLHFTVGARHTIDNKIGSVGVPNFSTPTFLESSRRSKALSPTASLSYNVTPDVMTYISYANGYKNGSFTPRLPFPDQVVKLPTSKPEFLTTYELGVKSDLLDNRLRFNVAGFYSNYDDIQISYTPTTSPPTPNPIVGNVAKARIRGLEFEMQALVTHDLQLTGSLGLMDAVYTSLSTLPTPFWSNRTPLERTPHYKGSLGLNYTFALPNSASLVLGADWELNAKQALEPDNAGRPLSVEGAWNSGNVSLGYVAPGEKWSFTVYADNVTNEDHRIQGLDSTRDSFGVAESLYNRPREFYATFNYRFK